MKILVILFFSLFLCINNGSYSIKEFLDYLQETGLWDVILNTKYFYCEDVAIDICKVLTRSSDCEIVVRVYMTEPSQNNCPNNPLQTMKKILIIRDREIKKRLTDEVLVAIISQCCPI